MSNLRDLQKAIGGALKPAAAPGGDPKATPLGPVVIDSRQVQPGDVFWGLVGRRHDGADFADDAFTRGAAGAVVRKPVDPPPDRWVLQVEDTQQALEQWAAHARGQFTGTVVAVTGSVGKSTTRQMIHTALKSRLSGTASPRNFNNRVGLPLSMLRIDPRHDYAVLELGASGHGEIASLAELCAPKIAVITPVGDAHLAGFGSRIGVAEAKTELLAAMPADGHAVLWDDPWLRRFAERCRAPVTWVGRGDKCDLCATEISWNRGVLRFRVDDCPFAVPVWGRHHLSGVLLAVGAARLMGMELKDTAKALEDFDPLPMRCEVVHLRGATIINDAYNANPLAMEAALELLRDFDAEGRRIFVCGDMAELGDRSAALHRQLGSQVVTVSGANLLIACGRFAHDVVAGARAAGMPRTRAIPCRTPEDALPYLGQTIVPGDVVLVKGSRSLAMERVFEALQQYPKRRSA